LLESHLIYEAFNIISE